MLISRVAFSHGHPNTSRDKLELFIKVVRFNGTVQEVSPGVNLTERGGCGEDDKKDLGNGVNSLFTS